MVRRICALVAVGSLALWGCGGDDDADSTPAATDAADPAPTEEADEPTDDQGADAEITIADFAFEGPAEVPVGTTVVITNTDGTAHTWTAVDGSFGSGELGEGDSFEFTFDEPGVYEYRCNFHPTMTGTITVTG